MRKLLLFCSALFILHSASAQTNVYHPFPDSGAVWNQHMQYYCFSGEYENDYYSVIMIGDTVINSLIYHKLSIQQVIQNPIEDTCMPMVVPGQQGCIRQDSLSKLVYYIYPFDTIEYILYDFNVQIGDSIGGGVISYMDSILIGTDYRKKWNITGCYNGCGAFIIEGIGSSSGVLRNPCNFCVPHSPDYTLNCFIQNGVVLYTDGTTQCNLIDAVKNIPEEKIAVTLSPNPFHTTATLEIKNEELRMKNCELKIYNTLGALVLQSSFSNLQSVIINRENLVDGLYFYELTTTNYELMGSGKFVVE